MEILGQILLGFVMCLILPVSHHFPVLERIRRSTQDLPWATPCSPSGGSNTNSGFVFPFQPPMADLISELYIRSHEGHILSEALKNQFFANRLDSSLDTALYLEQIHLDGHPLPSQVMDWQSKNETGDVLKVDFINLSTILVFLEQILVDDIEYKNSSSSAELKSLENKIFSILCQEDTILSSLGLNVENHVTRDVMANGLRDVNSIADRQKRDYTMAKDTLHLMKANKDNYMKMQVAYN